MISTLYIERDIATHPRAQAIIARYPKARHVTIDRYGDVFNQPSQNFRQQKQQPALILAKKHGRLALPTPPGYHIGGERNYYFSHMLNCVYDCRYCFLQGMYRSGNYVVFANFDDFFTDIRQISEQDSSPAWFLRTKSTQIRSLLSRQSIPNVVVAYSLSPAAIVEAHEHKTPSLEKRLHALQELQQAGWKIGLRFDPILYADNYKRKPFYKRMIKLYPDSDLLAQPMKTKTAMVSYPSHIEQDILGFCEIELQRYIRKDQYFPCISISNPVNPVSINVNNTVSPKPKRCEVTPINTQISSVSLRERREPVQ